MKKGLLIFLLLITNIIYAQTVIKGKVNCGKESIVGANIFIKNSYDGGSTDSKGFYKFSSDEKSKQIIVISSIGFETIEKEIFLDGKEIIIDFQLKEKANELNTVTITAGTFEAGAEIKKAMILSSLDIATTAGAEADIYSAIQTLPGAQAASQEEGLFVRGGSAAETKTLFDGMWVQKPFMNDMPNVAQRGRFSAFEFKGTTFSSGAYSAQYGQALSSVLILDSKDIADKTTSDIGVMSAGITAGHTERLKNSSFNVNASYFNLAPANSIIKQNIDWSKDPSSIALGGNYRAKTSATGLLKVFTSYINNSMALNRDNLDPIGTKMFIRNKDIASYTNVSYQEYLNDDWKINIGYALSIENNSFDLDSNKFKRDDYLNQARVGVNGYINKKLQAKVGIDYIFQNKQERFNNLDRKFDENLTANYAEFDYYFNHKWVVRAGVRSEFSSHIQQMRIVPRVSMAYKQNKLHQYSIAFGQFVQSPLDEYMIQSSNIKFEEAVHYLTNYQFQSEKYIFRIELYKKDYSKLITINPVDQSLSNNGKGYAQGFDIFWRDRKTIKRGDYWISYSYLDTKRLYKDFPVLATPKFASTHTFNVVYKEYIPKIHTQIAATYTYASGRTFYNPNSSEFLKDRTKDYHNISFNASYLTSIKSHFTVVFLSVGNMFGIKNVFGYQYSNDGTRRMAIEPNAPRTIFIGMFISIGDDNVLN